jgi:hypothetical protein
MEQVVRCLPASRLSISSVRGYIRPLNLSSTVTTTDIVLLIEDLKKGDEAVILFGKHLTAQGREQVAAILKLNFDHYQRFDYYDKFDCISSAAEDFMNENGRYPESEEDNLAGVTIKSI